MSDRLVKNQQYIDEVKAKWIKIFNLLTYAGSRKQEIYDGFDKKFGRDDWLPAHVFDGEVVSRYQGYRMYDEAYYEFLKNNPNIREWIVNTASEVIDFAESNIESGLDLSKQEGLATHLQDIAVRRALTRLALEEQGIEYDSENLPVIPIFKGDHIVQIRGHTTEGYRLNPGKVPFHKPELILDIDQKGWWDQDSIEDAYQKNKTLLVNPDKLLLSLAIVLQNTAFLRSDKQNYYLVTKEDLNALTRKSGRKSRRLISGQNLYTNYCEITDAPNMHYTDLKKVLEPYFDTGLSFEGKRIDYKTLADKLK